MFCKITWVLLFVSIITSYFLSSMEIITLNKHKGYKKIFAKLTLVFIPVINFLAVVTVFYYGYCDGIGIVK